MDVFECMRTRRAIRSFKPDPIEKEKLDKLLESLRMAPSAQNKQSVRYCLVTDPKLKHELVSKACHQEFIEGAPAVIVACAKKGWEADAVIGVSHLILAAKAEGLGTCWVMWVERAEAGRILNIPDEYECHTVVPIGYAAEDPEPKPRLPISELVKVNGF